MDEKLISVDEISIYKIIHGQKKSYPWIKVSSLGKMMDNFFICGCHPWMRRSNKDNRLRTWAQPLTDENLIERENLFMCELNLNFITFLDKEGIAYPPHVFFHHWSHLVN